MGSLTGKMYHLDCEPAISQEQASVAIASKEINGMDLWHQRLGHVNGQRLQDIVQKKLGTPMRFSKASKLLFCEGCVKEKMNRAMFKPVGEIHSTRKLQLVHSDVCGPMPRESIGGRRYFVTFIDDYSRCCAVYFIKHKSEVFKKFKEFEALTTNECCQRIGAI